MVRKTEGNIRIKISLVLAVFVFSALGFVGGTFYGFKEGIRNEVMLEEIAQGALSRHQLLSLEKGKMEYVIQLYESKIDTGLHRYLMYRESGNQFLSEIFLPESTSHIEEYVDLMVNHRKSHPIVFNASWASPVEGDDEETKQAKAQGYKESEKMLAEIKQLLRSRGVPDSGLAKQGVQAK